VFDFGFSKFYRDPHTAKHIPYREGRDGPGTIFYASANFHCGIEQSRWDDLEALGNVFLYLYHGRLPWQGSYVPDVKAKRRRMGEMKLAILDHLQGWPPELGEFFQHCRSLGFDEAPDYDHLRGLLQLMMARNGWDCDYQFDWSKGVETPNGKISPSWFTVKKLRRPQ